MLTSTRWAICTVATGVIGIVTLAYAIKTEDSILGISAMAWLASMLVGYAGYRRAWTRMLSPTEPDTSKMPNAEIVARLMELATRPDRRGRLPPHHRLVRAAADRIMELERRHDMANNRDPNRFETQVGMLRRILRHEPPF